MESTTSSLFLYLTANLVHLNGQLQLICNINYNNMKTLLLAVTFVLMVIGGSIPSSMNINLSKTYTADGSDAYDLSCSGANGRTTFNVAGLPARTYLDGDRIVIGQTAQGGNFILRITATDASGQVAERIVNLGIVLASSLDSGSSSTTTTTTSYNSGTTGSSSQFNGNNGFLINGIQSGTTGTTGTGGSISGSITTTGSSSTSGTTRVNGNNGVTITGGNPSGGVSPTGISGSSSTSRLNQIITTYSSITDVSTPNYPGNTYPVPKLPTGANPSVPNVTPLIISTTQTTPTIANRNTITADDVTLRAASQRHQNAIKSITNLLSIIDQARANKVQAQKDIYTYTTAYNQAVANQRAVQNSITTIEINITQISSAISNITMQINNIVNQYGQTQSERTTLIQRRTQFQNQLTPFNNQKTSIQAQINNLGVQIKQYQDRLVANKASCDNTFRQINDNKANLVALQQRSATLQSTIANLTALLSQKQSIVDDLQRRLNDAVADRDNTKRQLDQAIADRTSLPSQISGVTTSINQLQSSYDSCTRDNDAIQKTIDTLNAQFKDLNAQLTDINSRIQSIQTQIDTIIVRITQIDSSSPNTDSQLADLKDKLQFLKEQYTKTSTERTRWYTAGNDANNNVATSKQNLQAIIVRYNRQVSTETSATQNLERARAEEALARQALDQLISHYTNALPYAIVPNGNGQTNPGNPAGNNPSGSPLGPVKQGGDGAPGQFKITSWTNYLSQAYGAGVSPAFTGSVTALFPFSFSSVVKGNNVFNNIRSASGSSSGSGSASGSDSWGCGSNIPNLPSISTSGVIVAVRDTSFDLKMNDGSVATVNVAPCTSLNSNEQNYQIQTGDVAVVKAWQDSSSSLRSQSVTCLSTQ